MASPKFYIIVWKPYEQEEVRILCKSVNQTEKFKKKLGDAGFSTSIIHHYYEGFRRSEFEQQEVGKILASIGKKEDHFW